jgi:ribosome maturation factor RimP
MQIFAQKVMGIDVGLLQATIGPVLRAHGVASAEISYQKEQPGWVLRITVAALDSPSSGSVGVGLLADISRDMSTALDVADFIPQAYHLEVSSAGLDRPLRTAEDYQGAVGQTVKISLIRPAADGQRVLRGRLVGADERGVTVDVDGNPIWTDIANIEKAQTIYELPAQPPKGRPKAGKQKRH